MAYAVQLTISTGNKVSLNYQSQEVAVSLCYQLEREDTDLMQVVEEKSAEVAKAQRKARTRIRDEKLREANNAASNDERESEIASQSPSESLASEEHPASNQNADAETEGESSTYSQQVAIRRLLDVAQLSDEEVGERVQVSFSPESLSLLTKHQASQVLLVLQRHEREKFQALRS